jgi:excisionase family DNA binding protein
MALAQPLTCKQVRGWGRSKSVHEINPNEVYTTQETQSLLKISDSTMKRLLKKGIIRANKVGGNYRILGKELLHVLSPRVERQAVSFYQRLKKKAKAKIKTW